MNAKFSKLLFIGVLFVCRISMAQVSVTVPEKWTNYRWGINGFWTRRVELPNNRPEQINRELLDTNTVRLIAEHAGLSKAELAEFVVAPRSDGDDLALYQLGSSSRKFDAFFELLRSYADTRQSGHSAAFYFAAMTNQIPVSSIPDPDLRALASDRPHLPISWVTKAESGTFTNKAGQITSVQEKTTIVNGKEQQISVTNMPKVDEVCRWVTCVIADGEIGWRYRMTFKPDGRLDHVNQDCCDVKEFDPKYRGVIQQVNDESREEMKKNGTYHKLGSVHEFWHLKKEKLKARGIVWRSPSELNPGTNYD